MTLFVVTPRRQFEIHDGYVVAVAFLLAFAVGKITKAVIEKQSQKPKNIANPRGGNLTIDLDVSDDTELAKLILSCISDNERYMLKDRRMIQIVFNLVKAKVKNESLILTPNLLRFLALTLLRNGNDRSLIVKLGNIIAFSNNQIRLFARLMGAGILGFLGALVSTLPAAALMMVLFFGTTENCGYKCSDYFEQLPKEGPLNIHEEKSTGHVFIGANDDARQIAIYPTSKATTEVTVVASDGSLTRKQSYQRIRSKAKQVNFSDFKKTDPVLSTFSDLEEPHVPQKKCLINDVHDVTGMRID